MLKSRQKISGIEEKDREFLLRSITDVGISKAIGYLPLATIYETLQLNDEFFEDLCATKGLIYRKFLPGECCINSGAIFVWDRELLMEILQKDGGPDFRNPNTDADYVFVETIAADWFSSDHKLIPLIQRAFGQGASPTSA